MSIEVDKSWFLMCNARLSGLREKAMMALASGNSIPEAVIDYVSAVEQAFLGHEANQRSASCRDMWDQFRKPMTFPRSGELGSTDAQLGPGGDDLDG